MKKYLSLCQEALDHGFIKSNRTGIDTIGYQGDMRKYYMDDGFPIVTTKKVNIEKPISEMMGFWRGYTNAADFRALGCSLWDANANENKTWLNNPHRKGIDDLGPIYGHSSRHFGAKWMPTEGSKMGGYWMGGIDQLKNVYDKLLKGDDNRRLIVSHWNPLDMDKMSLPPCHVLYKFGIEQDRLNLSMFQRSCDLPLGVPYNIAGYSWLLHVMAKITNLKPGHFTHFMDDIHVYKNQIDLLKGQLERTPHELPQLYINPKIKTLEDLETWVTPGDFKLINYKHDAYINYPFAV